MDQQSRSIAGSVPAIIRNGGAERRFAKLAAVYAHRLHYASEHGINSLYLQFEKQTLEVSSDPEFYTDDRIHLNVIEHLSPERIAACIDVCKAPLFASLLGLDLDAIRWELLAGLADQHIVLQFYEHRKHLGRPDQEITLLEDDFQLRLFYGAPIFPTIAFDPGAVNNIDGSVA